MTYAIVFCTCPVGPVAETLATTLVDEQLAACVHLMPGATSIYRWQGKRETSHETVLIIKTRQEVYGKLEQRIKALHPYEVPEILLVKVEAGLPSYLAWMDNNLATST